MTNKDFKLLLNSTNEDIKLMIKTENGIKEIDTFELNYKEGYMILNPKTTLDC